MSEGANRSLPRRAASALPCSSRWPWRAPRPRRRPRRRSSRANRSSRAAATAATTSSTTTSTSATSRAAGSCTARDVIEARATAGLSEVLARPRRAEGHLGQRSTAKPAKYSRGRGKVKIVAGDADRQGAKRSRSTCATEGVPRKVTDPDGSTEGWYRTKDGAVAVGEPVGTAAWLACNNAPRDKASFDIQITVPAGVKAVSNGRLRVAPEGRTGGCAGRGRNRSRWPPTWRSSTSARASSSTGTSASCRPGRWSTRGW